MKEGNLSLVDDINRIQLVSDDLFFFQLIEASKRPAKLPTLSG